MDIMVYVPDQHFPAYHVWPLHKSKFYFKMYRATTSFPWWKNIWYSFVLKETILVCCFLTIRKNNVMQAILLYNLKHDLVLYYSKY